MGLLGGLNQPKKCSYLSLLTCSKGKMGIYFGHMEMGEIRLSD